MPRENNAKENIYLLENRLQLRSGISGIGGGRKPERNHEGAEGAQNVASHLQRGESFDTGHSQLGPPGPVQEQLAEVLANRLGSLSPGELGGGGGDNKEKQ